MDILLLIFGLALLVKGADHLVESASDLAERLAVPKMLVALTIVAMGTSLPELTVNMFAVLDDKFDIVYGNVIGSNISNLLLILGVSGLISQIEFGRRTTLTELPISMAVVILLFVMSHGLTQGFSAKAISRLDGAILLSLFAAFLAFSFAGRRNDGADGDESEGEGADAVGTKRSLAVVITILAASLCALLYGGKLTVDAAVAIARAFGLSEKLIALTIISIGTSLPELMTSSIAAYRGQHDISTGNIIGSNIFNVLMIMGACAAVRPVSYNAEFNADIGVLMTATTYVMAVLFAGKRYHFGRLKAAPLLLGFIGYMYFLIARN